MTRGNVTIRRQTKRYVDLVWYFRTESIITLCVYDYNYFLELDVLTNTNRHLLQAQLLNPTPTQAYNWLLVYKLVHMLMKKKEFANRK